MKDHATSSHHARHSGTCGGLQYFHFHGRPVPASYLPVAAAHGQQLSNTTILIGTSALEQLSWAQCAELCRIMGFR